MANKPETKQGHSRNKVGDKLEDIVKSGNVLEKVKTERETKWEIGDRSRNQIGNLVEE